MVNWLWCWIDDNVQLMMMDRWCWLCSIYDDGSMIGQWWSIDDDDQLMMINWWWLSINDDDRSMMMIDQW